MGLAGEAALSGTGFALGAIGSAFLSACHYWAIQLPGVPTSPSSQIGLGATLSSAWGYGSVPLSGQGLQGQ